MRGSFSSSGRGRREEIESYEPCRSKTRACARASGSAAVREGRKRRKCGASGRERVTGALTKGEVAFYIRDHRADVSHGDPQRIGGYAETIAPPAAFPFVS